MLKFMRAGFQLMLMVLAESLNGKEAISSQKNANSPRKEAERGQRCHKGSGAESGRVKSYRTPWRTSEERWSLLLRKYEDWSSSAGSVKATTTRKRGPSSATAFTIFATPASSTTPCIKFRGSRRSFVLFRNAIGPWT